MKQLPSHLHPIAAWRVDLPKTGLQHAAVDHVFVAIDRDFPLSEPRIIAPQAVGRLSPPWPHVEKSGVLCLTTTRFSAPAGERVLTMLQHALDVLDMDEDSRADEFRREFSPYWSHHVKSGTDKAYSLIETRVEDRDVWFHRTASGRVVFADDPDALVTWLNNAGTPANEPLKTTRLTWPAVIPLPAQYPLTARDVMGLVGREHIERHVRAGSSLPLLFGFMIDGAPVFSAVAVSGASEKDVTRGFRKSHPPPNRVVADRSFAKLTPMSVQRADAKWIHGREANHDLDRLAASSVAIVGCGAIGGYLARGLAQAGVGSLTLIDPDELKPSNIGRHVLGAEWIGKSKVVALAAQIRRDFPHIRAIEVHETSFQNLDHDATTKLAESHVLVLAGVDLKAELAVDRLIGSLEHPPVRVWTWTEEFALAGHAVALVGPDRIGDALDEDGLYRGRLTSDWDADEVIVREAGCGVSFQPYDAIDMMSTVVVAQRLITDALLGKVPESTDRVWLGDRNAVLDRGGKPTEAFDRSFCELRREWPGE